VPEDRSVRTRRLQPNTQPSAPSLWPIGFAIGLACVLVGLVVSTPAVVVGIVIAVVCGALWIRDAARGVSTTPALEPETRASTPPPEHPVDEEDEPASYSRMMFLSGATLGLGGLIGGVVTVPAVGFMIAPAFVRQHPKSVDIGPVTDFPEGQYVIATFLRDPSQGEVSRRTAYIRNNGVVNGVPSLTIISNRCAHLGCPVQPNGPVFDNKKTTVKTTPGEEISIIPMIPAGGFGCPCHGGQYDQEGNRVAGPPVRALDRFEYEIKDGHVVLLGTYSVAHVTGTGAAAKIKAYTLTGPGEHVDGIESWLYPLQPPH
jgi:menaquinol-cytochrome c reductase iron-sulfur subunit